MSRPNLLVVEDTDLQGVVIGLMKHYVKPWGSHRDEWPVYIKGRQGKSAVFKPKELMVEMKGSGIQTVGIVVDADTDAKSTWAQVRGFCQALGGTPPEACPKTGFITSLPTQRFGAWIMPNNELNGMVEDFCHLLVPEQAKELWGFAGECAKNAKKKYGAPFSDAHYPKAHIHTWLAWQETPGERMGAAITSETLHHSSDEAQAFVKWFCDLFQLCLENAAQ